MTTIRESRSEREDGIAERPMVMFDPLYLVLAVAAVVGVVLVVSLIVAAIMIASRKKGDRK